MTEREKCVYGGGLWTIDEGRGAIILYGCSFDFGPPDFDYVSSSCSLLSVEVSVHGAEFYIKY